MIVSDASPLINLAKAEKLYLLKKLFGKVLIEEEVRKEAIERGKEEGAPDALLIEKAFQEGWIEVLTIKKEKSIIGLHKGENNSILLAKEQKYLVLIDEEDGREVARAMGLKVKGCLFVLKKAVEKGLLSENNAIRALDDMMAGGFRISVRVYVRFLAEVRK
jgi:predicted nucleic acid-binding protein